MTERKVIWGNLASIVLASVQVGVEIERLRSADGARGDWMSLCLWVLILVSGLVPVVRATRAMPTNTPTGSS